MTTAMARAQKILAGVALAATFGAVPACMSPDRAQSLRDEIDATTPRCTTPHVCEVMWEEARRWVDRHSARADDRYDPNRGDTTQANMNASQILMSVRRHETPEGFWFEFRGRCLNLLPCRPSVLEEHLRFNRFLRSVGALSEDERATSDSPQS